MIDSCLINAFRCSKTLKITKYFHFSLIRDKTLPRQKSNPSNFMHWVEKKPQSIIKTPSTSPVKTVSVYMHLSMELSDLSCQIIVIHNRDSNFVNNARISILIADSDSWLNFNKIIWNDPWLVHIIYS